MAESFLDIWKIKNRGRRDYNRHNERIKKAIKDNLHDLITEQNIISSDGKKKVKIPIKELEQYRFKYKNNNDQEGVGQGIGEDQAQPGDIIGHDGTGKKKENGSKAGEGHQDTVYEEVDLQSVIDMMLEDLELPWLEDKDKAQEIETEKIVFKSISEKGNVSNIDKRRTILENMKRNAQKYGKAKIHRIHNDDLRYKIYEQETEFKSNAVVMMALDRSGSMDTEKKYLAKSMFFWLAHFCKTRYQNIELVFIVHDTEAEEIDNEEDFFKVSSGGGTKCSAAFLKAKDIISERYNPADYNIYMLEISDGDSWNDNEISAEVVNEMSSYCNLVAYCELSVGYWINSGETLHSYLENNVKAENFSSVKIKDKSEIYTGLKKILSADK